MASTYDAKLRVCDALVELVMEAEDVLQRRCHGLQAPAQVVELRTKEVTRWVVHVQRNRNGTHLVVGGAHLLAAHALLPVRKRVLELDNLGVNINNRVSKGSNAR